MDCMSAYEAMLAAAGAPVHADRVLAMRRRFEERTGAFGPDDPWFEARSRAFWDDAVTSPEFAGAFGHALPPEARPWLSPFTRAHRGLFHAEPDGDGPEGTWTLWDQWRGAAFVIDPPTAPGLLEALRAATLFDGRVVATHDPLTVTLLPGAVFHPEDATEPIARVLASARARSLHDADLYDMLLRMERNLRSHSRVKASYAYRV